MRGLVYHDQTNNMVVDWDSLKDWQVKNPNGPHSMKNKTGGSCSFENESYRKYLSSTKKGIFFIDKRLKVYVFFSREVLEKYPPEPKAHLGMPNSFYVYSNLKNIVNQERLEMIPFGKVEIPKATGPAVDIKSKFGL